MPDEETLNANLNTIADLTNDRPAPETPSEQGPAPRDLPAAPHLQTVRPGEHLSAAQVETLMGDEEAQQVNRELSEREGVNPDTES